MYNGFNTIVCHYWLMVVHLLRGAFLYFSMQSELNSVFANVNVDVERSSELYDRFLCFSVLFFLNEKYIIIQSLHYGNISQVIC